MLSILFFLALLLDEADGLAGVVFSSKLVFIDRFAATLLDQFLVVVGKGRDLQDTVS